MLHLEEQRTYNYWVSTSHSTLVTHLPFVSPFFSYYYPTIKMYKFKRGNWDTIQGNIKTRIESGRKTLNELFLIYY